MRVFLILLVKELRSVFFSPVAWVVMGLVMVMNGFSFMTALTKLEESAQGAALADYTFNSVPFWLAYFFIFPAITMRLFSEEQKLGTIETLLTVPVRSLQVILSKYSAALIFYAILWVPSLVNFTIFRFTCVTDANTIGSLGGSYTIIFLVGVFNIAIGCFASALTSNQIVAAMTCFTICLVHFLLGFALFFFSGELPAHFQEFIAYFSTLDHVRKFIDGLVDTRPFVYYISFAALFLFLTHHVLEFRKWKA